MSDTGITIAVYAGLGLIIAIVIFAGAFWFANAAKKGNLRFKWRQRRSERAANDPQRRAGEGRDDRPREDPRISR